MIHFEVNNQKYLAVPVTKDAIVVKIGKDFAGKTCVVCKISKESKNPYGITLPEGNWEIVGLVKDRPPVDAMYLRTENNLTDNHLILKQL